MFLRYRITNMADWCVYGVGLNSGDISEICEDEAIEDADNEECSYNEPLLFIETENMGLFYPGVENENQGVEATNPFIVRGEGQITISKEHPNFSEICGLIRDSIFPNTYIVEDGVVDFRVAMEFMKTQTVTSISIWEAEIENFE